MHLDLESESESESELKEESGGGGCGGPWPFMLRTLSWRAFLVPARRYSPPTCSRKFPRKRSATHVGVVMRDPSQIVTDVLVAKL